MCDMMRQRIVEVFGLAGYLRSAAAGGLMPEHDLYAVMRTTRAVRKLRPDPIPEEVLRRVLTAATWGPSGGNRQPWRILAVRDLAAKRRLGELYQGAWTPYA